MGKFALELPDQSGNLERAKNLLFLLLHHGASEGVIQTQMSIFTPEVQDQAIAAVKAEKGAVDK